jgi:anti-sigma B factor antagonist
VQITLRPVATATILDIEEERLEYPKTVVLKNQIVRLLKEGQLFLALNLTAVRSLDSFGLAVIISLMKECKAQKGNLAVFGLNEFNQRLVEMTKLSQVLTIGLNEEDAIKLLHEAEPAEKASRV